MSDFSHLVTVKAVPDLLKAIAFVPPAWTRLEPQSTTGDPAPGLEARVHDPLWLLARQWQFGEFRGEDAGTPIGVEVETASQRATAWQPGETPNGEPPRAFGPDDLLDQVVEREPAAASGASLRARVEAGSALLAALDEAGFDARSLLLQHAAFEFEGDDVPRRLRTLARAVPDAERVAIALEAGAPVWLTGAPAAATASARAWLDWYRAGVSPRQAQAAPAWVPERLEYRFSVRTGTGDDQRVWRAPLHEGGAIDWYSFDSDAAARMELASEPADAGTTTRRLTMLASPLQYAGMPSDRLWQFENGAVNFGRFEIQRHDLARLCLVEFAMIYGDDWFVVPLDVDAGSFTTVREVAYTTTFGDRLVVPPADDRGRAGRFRLFEHNQAGSAESSRGLFIPPSARRTLEGAALEDVLFLRDESANMAWAIEATVATPLGDPRQRREEPQPPPDPVSLLPGAELQYRLATVVPRHWIPLVPVRTNGRGGFILRKGTMTDRDEAVGEVLRPTPLHLQEEEVPREGVRVRRVPALARSRDGTYRRWITRRISVGRGEGASALAFDGAYR